MSTKILILKRCKEYAYKILETLNEFKENLINKKSNDLEPPRWVEWCLDLSTFMQGSYILLRCLAK